MRWPTAGWLVGSRTVWAGVMQCVAELEGGDPMGSEISNPAASEVAAF